MAVGLRAYGTVLSGTTEPYTPALPTGHAAGDLLIVLSGNKSSTPTTATPTGYTAGDSVTGGAGSEGIDTGTTRLSMFWKEDGGSETAQALDLSAAPSPRQGIVMGFTKGATETWDVAMVSAGDTSGSTTQLGQLTFGSLDVTTGDWLLVCSQLNGDVIANSSHTFAIPGITNGTETERIDQGTNQGNDGRLVVLEVQSVTGNESGVPTYTMAWSGNSSSAGCTIVIRIRAVPPGSTDLVIANAAHAQTAENVVLVPDLAIANAAHGQTAQNLALTQVHSLAVANATHGQTAENVVLTVPGTDLVIANATHAQTAENLTLTQAHNLTVQNAAHGQTAGSLALTQVHNLTVQNATHAQTAGQLTLTQVHQLVVANATHGSTAENLTLTVATALVIADAAHGQTAGALALTQVHALVVAGAAHGQTATQLALTQIHQLVVAAATHGQTAETVVFITAVFNAFSQLYDQHAGAIEYRSHSIPGGVT